MTEVLAEQLETEESMFVQTAQGIDSDGQDPHVARDHAVDAPFLR